MLLLADARDIAENDDEDNASLSLWPDHPGGG
jgi:hypothetical protein